MMVAKDVNRYTSNEFHDWQRKNLPSQFVLQDIDTWVLVWADGASGKDPFAIVELKRSYIEPAKWSPYAADKPNYLSLYKLSKRANLPLWIIYFKKGEEINGNSEFHIFNVNEVKDSGTEWITFTSERVVKASHFKAKFPAIFSQ